MNTNKHTGLYRVKPWRDEEWKPLVGHSNIYRIDPPIGRPYHIHINSDGLTSWTNGSLMSWMPKSDYPDLESAKLACWNDYLERLLPALEEVTPEDAVEIIREAVSSAMPESKAMTPEERKATAKAFTGLFGKEGV